MHREISCNVTCVDNILETWLIFVVVAVVVVMVVFFFFFLTTNGKKNIKMF